MLFLTTKGHNWRCASNAVGVPQRRKTLTEAVAEVDSSSDSEVLELVEFGP